MDSEQPKRSSSAFEYFLYTAILAETGLAALIYKVLFRSPDLARMRVYLGVFYFAFLGWAIAQLNMLHRDRKAPVVDAMPVLPPPAPKPEALQLEHSGEDVAAEDARSAFGLTTPQFVIVVVVFAMAVATFSCALRLLP